MRIRIGYPGINRTLPCSSSRTFRLANYSPERFVEMTALNIACLRDIIAFNVEHGLTFFRISSDLVPFASHEVLDVDWQPRFVADLRAIGDVAVAHNFRLSMHPDQFILINALDEDIFARSVAELAYHADVLDLLGVDATHKIQIHVGGVYGDKHASLDRFARRFEGLPEKVRRRLAVENDDRLYDLDDCLTLHRRTGVPVIFDTFHHELNNQGESLAGAIELANATWQDGHGPLMMDYSSQEPGARAGKHAESVELSHFLGVLNVLRELDVPADIMFEIKDKEKSALRAKKLLRAEEAHTP